MKVIKGLTTLTLVIGVSACSTNQTMPLIFGQSHTVGITIGASTTDQGGEFVLGYKDRNIALIPVTTPQSSGDSTLVKATVGASQDAMSVIGQFEVNSETKDADVGLGKFFATGIAAQQLATGFKNKLQGKSETETDTPTP